MAFNYALLDKRAVFSLSGDDRFDYLQGILTQDVAPCRYGNVAYGLMLQAQGKFMCDMFVVPAEDKLWLDVSGSYAESVEAKLGLYKLGRNVTLERVPAKIYACWGEDVPAGDDDILIYDDVREGARFKRLLVAGMMTSSIFQNGEKVNVGEYRRRRIFSGLPDGDEDLSFNASYPLDFGMDKIGAFSFSKGCYIGQEVTARMYYKGKRKKALISLHAESGETFPIDGGDVMLSGKKIGHITSSEGDAALALLTDRSEYTDNQKVTVGAMQAKMANLPFAA